MNGSEQQTTWAIEIKKSKMQEFETLQSKVISPIGTKALDYIMSLDAASYWIDNRDRSAADMLKSLLRGGLNIKGNQYSDKATIDPASGLITITSKVIVQDGQGGHYETIVKTI